MAFVSAASAQSTTARPGSNVVSNQVPSVSSVFAPNATIVEGFATVSGTATLCSLAANLTTAGWFAKNNAAAPVGATCVFNGGAGTTFPAQAGAATEYAAMNFNASTGANAISTWFVTPRVTFGTGAKLEFWTRAAGSFADRLEVRTSVAADAGTPDVGTLVGDVGTFTNLALTINPALTITDIACPATSFTAAASTLGGYPNTAWCKVTIEGAALPASGTGRIAFRHQVTNAGPSGANSNFIGIDTFSFVEGVAGGTTVVAGTPAGAVTIPPRTLPTASATATLSFTASAASSTTCVATGAGYSVSPSPLTLPAATAASVTVTQNSAAAGTYTGTVTCTNAAGATPASFVYNFTHVVNGAPVVLIPTPALNLWGAFALLAGLGLFGAFAVRRFS